MNRTGNGYFELGNAAAHREVPVEVVRDAFERSGISAAELARRLGWTRPDGTRVQRQLGLIDNRRSRGSRAARRATMTTGRAIEIIEAIGADPADIDW